MSVSFDLRYLRYFIAVAEELNFTRAAEQLHTVQPSLSQQIRRLEEIVGTPLFWREKHHLQLSAAGRVFLVEARKLLVQANEAVEAAQRAARAESGSLAVSFAPGAEGRFANFLHQLHESYPSVRISLRSLQSREQLEAMRNQSIDAGFMAGPVEDDEIETELVDSQKTVVILPSTHPLAKRKAVPIRKLQALPLIKPSCLVPAYCRIIDEIEKQNGLKLKTSVEVDNWLASIHEVANGVGYSLVPEYVAYILPKGLVARPLEMKTQPMLDLMLAYRKDNLSPALQLFISAFHEYWRKENT
jgi:LysR family hca operon transcriptional activator